MTVVGRSEGVNGFNREPTQCSYSRILCSDDKKDRKRKREESDEEKERKRIEKEERRRRHDRYRVGAANCSTAKLVVRDRGNGLGHLIWVT